MPWRWHGEPGGAGAPGRAGPRGGRRARGRPVMETEAPVAGPAGPGGPHAGTHRRAGAALAGSVHPGGLPASGVSLSERLTALARLVQIGSARVGPDGFNAGLLADAEALL